MQIFILCIEAQLTEVDLQQISNKQKIYFRTCVSCHR